MDDLPGRKKILLHLVDKEKVKQDNPCSFSYCQEGIAEAVGLSQNRVSKLLEDMKDKGIVEEDFGDVKGSPQRRKIYYLSEKGVSEAEKLKESLEEEIIKIKTESGVSKIELKEIGKYVTGSRLFLFAVNHMDPDSFLDLTDIGEKDTDKGISSQEIEDFRSKNYASFDAESFDWKDTRKIIMKKTGRVEIPDESVDLILDITDGTPLFITTLLNEMIEKGILDPLRLIFPKSIEELPLPKKIESIYRPKYQELSDKGKEILEFCSCMRKDVPFDLIENAIDLKKKDIDEVTDVGLLTKNSQGELSFPHNMIKFTVYKTIPSDKKKELHNMIAEELKSADTEDEESYFSIGEHYENAGVSDKACKFYLKAAQKAKDRYDNEDALKAFDHLLELDEKSEVENIDKSDILENIVDLQIREKDFKKALDSLDNIKAKSERFEDLIRLDRKRATCMRKMRDYEEALDLVEKRLNDLSQRDGLSFDLEREKCRLFKEKGMVHLRKNDYDESQKIFLELKRLSKKIDCRKDEATAIHYLGALAYFRSDFNEAKEKLQRAIEIREDINDLEGLSGSYTNLGVVHRNLQEHRKALKYHKKANDIEKKIGSENGSPSALTNIGNVYDDLGELDKAIEHHEKCLEIEKERGDIHGIASSLDNIGVIYSKKGEFDKAIEYNKKSLEEKKKLGNRLGISFSYYNLGGSYREKSEFDEAIDFLEESLEIREDLGDRLDQGYSELELGITYLDMIKVDKARSHLERALDIFKGTQTDHGMGIALSYLGKLYTMEGSMEEAKKVLEYGENIKSNLDEFRLELIVERHLAEYHLKNNRIEKALSYCEKSVHKAKKSEMINELGKGKKVLGKIYHKKKLYWKAAEEFKEAIDIFDRTGSRKNKADALFSWGKLSEESKTGDDPQKKIEKALELFKECGVNTRYIQ